jgi:N-methylhydantoinase A
MMDDPVELVAVRATMRTPLPRRGLEPAQAPGSADGRPPRSVDAFSFGRGERLPFTLIDRAGLTAGDVVEGPAIVVEETATTYLDTGYTARVDPSGCLLLDREGA